MKLKYTVNLLLLFIFCSISTITFGQEGNMSTSAAEANTEQTQNEQSAPTPTKKSEIPTTNVLHQNKRINLVVFVLAVIFAGIILYLARIENTLSKLEK